MQSVFQGRRQGDFALPAGIDVLHPLRREPGAEARLGEGRAEVQIVGKGRKLAFERIDLIDGQAGGEDKFMGSFPVGEGEHGFVPLDHEGMAFPDGHADEGRAVKAEQQKGKVFAEVVGHAGGKALQDVLGKGDAFAGEVNFRKETFAAIKPEAVDAPERGAF